jgi:hypothetical protein
MENLRLSRPHARIVKELAVHRRAAIVKHHLVAGSRAGAGAVANHLILKAALPDDDAGS